MDSTPSIFNLTPAEKLQLVEDLWDDLAASPESVPMHEWQQDELAARKASYLAHPDTGVSWEAIKQRIRSHHGA